MASVALKTRLNIRDAVLRRARQTSEDSIIVNAVEGFINDRYQEVLAAPIKWRWRREERQLKIVGKYTTGTASVTNGVRSVVFSDATGPDLLYRKIFIDGDKEYYRIISFDETTDTAILDAAYLGDTNATASFTVFKDEYGLWPDFEEIDDVINHYTRRPVDRVGPSRIVEKVNQNPRREGKVDFVTIDGNQNYDGIPMGPMVMGYDFMGIPLSKQLRVFPHIADADHILNITYIKKALNLEVDEDEPLMPEEDRIVLMYGALADLYKLLNDDQAFSIFEAKYSQKLGQMTSDQQETDDNPQLIAKTRYRRDASGYGSARDDYGIIFDIS